MYVKYKILELIPSRYRLSYCTAESSTPQIEKETTDQYFEYDMPAWLLKNKEPGDKEELGSSTGSKSSNCNKKEIPIYNHARPMHVSNF